MATQLPDPPGRLLAVPLGVQRGGPHRASGQDARVGVAEVGRQVGGDGEPGGPRRPGVDDRDKKTDRLPGGDDRTLALRQSQGHAERGGSPAATGGRHRSEGGGENQEAGEPPPPSRTLATGRGTSPAGRLRIPLAHHPALRDPQAHTGAGHTLWAARIGASGRRSRRGGVRGTSVALGRGSG